MANATNFISVTLPFQERFLLFYLAILASNLSLTNSKSLNLFVVRNNGTPKYVTPCWSFLNPKLSPLPKELDVNSF